MLHMIPLPMFKDPKEGGQVWGIKNDVSPTTMIAINVCKVEIHHMHNELEKIKKMLKE